MGPNDDNGGHIYIYITLFILFILLLLLLYFIYLIFYFFILFFKHVFLVELRPLLYDERVQNISHKWLNQGMINRPHLLIFTLLYDEFHSKWMN
jgi:hypothetical protein